MPAYRIIDDHNDLLHKGNYLHSIIDTHIDAINNPHNVTKSQILTGNLITDADISNSAGIAANKLDLSQIDQDVILGTGQKIKIYSSEATPTLLDALEVGNVDTFGNTIKIGVASTYIQSQAGIMFGVDAKLRYWSNNSEAWRMILEFQSGPDKVYIGDYQLDNITLFAKSHAFDTDLIANAFALDSGNATITLGDAAGVNNLFVNDINDAVVASIDSLGYLTCVGANFGKFSTSGFVVENDASFPGTPGDYQLFIRSDEGKVYFYNAGLATPNWQEIGGGGVTDHGALTGKEDDDHPEYFRLNKAAQTHTVNASSAALSIRQDGAGNIVDFYDGVVNVSYIKQNAIYGATANYLISDGSYYALAYTSGGTTYLYCNFHFAIQTANDGNAQLTLEAGYMNLDIKNRLAVRDWDASFAIRAQIESTNGHMVLGGSTNPSANEDLLLMDTGIIKMKETSTPTATVDYGALRFGSDNKLYAQTGDGVEHEVLFA